MLTLADKIRRSPGGVLIPAAPPAGGALWNPADDIDGSMTYTESNALATGAGANYWGVRSVVGYSDGASQYRCAGFDIVAGPVHLGLSEPEHLMDSDPGNDSNKSISMWSGDQNIYQGGSTLGNFGSPAVGNNHMLVFKVVSGVKKLYLYNANTGLWNNSGTANPATDTGGITILDPGFGPYTWYINLQAPSPGAVRLKAAASPPAGASAWG